MGKYRSLIWTQTKRIGKDNLLLILSVYPLILAVVGKYLIPFLREAFLENLDLSEHYPAILVFFILANPYIYGSLAAFTLLDEREENVLQAIRVTPLKLSNYLGAKVLFFVIVSIATGVLITWYINLVTIGLGESVMINSLMALSAPLSMLMINSFAKNRVEGFALVKGTGFMILLPALAFYVPERYSLLAGVIPGYWPAMAINKLSNPSFGLMPYWGYLLVGLLYILLLIMILYHRFSRKISS
ncbi:MAG: ABC transporter permease [Halanaerobiales bacterium]|nr:ABC transporter permease [Halanaerobiales bacterium]